MDLQAFEAAVAQAEEPDVLWRLFTGFFKCTVVRRVVYHHLPPPGAPDDQTLRLVTDGFPEELVARYVAERIYRHNPILLHARNSPEPFYWHEILDEKALSDREQAFLDALRLHGLGDGIGIQVFGPNGRNGYCGLGLPPGVHEIDAARVRSFHWACQLAHLRYCAILVPSLGEPPSLSPRENEVLVWVARGKSNLTIGEILGISVHTVDAHLRRIYLKLGVFDRVSAAVRGIGIGLVHTGT